MSEFFDIARAVSEALDCSEMICLVTAVRVHGSAPRHASARILIWLDGRTFGTIGGGAL